VSGQGDGADNFDVALRVDKDAGAGRAVKECLEQVTLLRKLQNFGFFVFRKFSLNACKKIGVGIIEVNQCPSVQDYENAIYNGACLISVWYACAATGSVGAAYHSDTQWRAGAAHYHHHRYRELFGLFSVDSGSE
jgi:hypothetical protein